MTRTIYRTATSLNGYIADEHSSLAWLFAVDNGGVDDHGAFLSGVGVIVEGSTTYEWVLRETGLLGRPEQWSKFYGDRPTFVFTSRALRYQRAPTSGSSADLLPSICRRFKLWPVSPTSGS